MSVIDRLNEALVGRYGIVRELGEGGMATVYLADDLKHERKVALKVLKPELAAVVGAERFITEIKTTANLQHPHILPLFDSGEADGFLFYVMPYVEGESLRERIDRERQLPVDEAVRIAVAVAGALQVAHEAGVIHRDIKPANILLGRGQPLVADFGIALAVGAAGGSRLTETGLSVGTPFYMSPEQATGDQHVGPPSDVYALTAVLYEMLVGDPPYMGSTAQAVLGKILQGDPVSATSTRKSVPLNVDAAIRKGLERIPADRFADADELVRALQDPAFRHGDASEATGAAGVRRLSTIALASSLVVGALTGAGIARALFGETEPPPPVVRIIEMGDSTNRVGNRCCGPSVAITPDGGAVAFLVRNEAGSSLFVRRLDEFSGHRVEGTDLATTPFFSPDGRWLGFVHDGDIMKVDLAGGSPQRVASTGFGSIRGATWSPDGTIYLTSTRTESVAGGLFAVSAQGGEIERVTVADTLAGEMHQWVPQILPDGRHILYTSWPDGGGDADAWVAVLDLDDGTTRRLTRGIQPYFSRTGHIVYALADGSLMARPFDPGRLEVSGEPVRLAEGVMTHNAADAEYAVSLSGTVAYRTGQGVGSSEEVLRYFTTDGGTIDALPAELRRSYPRFSPDGSRLAFAQWRGEQASEGTDIWVLDRATGIETRLTTTGQHNVAPVWSRDGSTILYSVPDGESGSPPIMARPADLSAPARPFGDVGGILGMPSRSGGPIPFTHFGSGLEADTVDIWIMDEDGANPRPLLATPNDERQPAVSPSGDWIAYTSDESGGFEVYVQPFPDLGPVSRISINGGIGPVWISDDELIYRSPGVALVKVSVQRAGTVLRATGHRDILTDIGHNLIAPRWDVQPDASRIAIISGQGSPALFIEVNRLHHLSDSGG